mgnify:CR=1 FL=1
MPLLNRKAPLRQKVVQQPVLTALLSRSTEAAKDSKRHLPVTFYQRLNRLAHSHYASREEHAEDRHPLLPDFFHEAIQAPRVHFLATKYRYLIFRGQSLRSFHRPLGVLLDHGVIPTTLAHPTLSRLEPAPDLRPEDGRRCRAPQSTAAAAESAGEGSGSSSSSASSGGSDEIDQQEAAR